MRQIWPSGCFTTIKNHNTLKPGASTDYLVPRFTTIKNHNTLKLNPILSANGGSFTTIKNHNTLKPQIAFSCSSSLQVYPLTPGGAVPDSVSLFKNLA